MRRLLMTAMMVMMVMGLGALKLKPHSVMAGIQHVVTPVAHAQGIPTDTCFDIEDQLQYWAGQLTSWGPITPFGSGYAIQFSAYFPYAGGEWWYGVCWSPTPYLHPGAPTGNGTPYHNPNVTPKPPPFSILRLPIPVR